MFNVINRLGFRILESRVAKGLTQEELGILVGLKSPRLEIWQFELGVKSPRFEILEKIANNLDLTVEQLCNYDIYTIYTGIFYFDEPLDLYVSMDDIFLFLKRFNERFPKAKVECFHIGSYHNENKVSHIHFCFTDLPQINNESIKEFESLWQDGSVKFGGLVYSDSSSLRLKNYSLSSDFKKQMCEINEHIAKTWKEYKICQ